MQQSMLHLNDVLGFDQGVASMTAGTQVRQYLNVLYSFCRVSAGTSIQKNYEVHKHECMLPVHLCPSTDVVLTSAFYDIPSLDVPMLDHSMDWRAHIFVSTGECGLASFHEVLTGSGGHICVEFDQHGAQLLVILTQPNAHKGVSRALCILLKLLWRREFHGMLEVR